MHRDAHFRVGDLQPASTTVLGVAGSPYTVTATFNSTGADPNFVSTATKATTATVNKDTTTTTVSESPTSVTYGNELASIFTASVVSTHGEAVPNSETVTVTVGSTNCTVTLTAGTGTCTIANTALAASGTTYAVSATYAGDANLSGSTGSAATGLTISPDSATVSTFTVTGSPAAYGAETSLVFSTSVASGHGEGIPNTDTVTVTQGATTLCTVTLTSGSGTCSPASTTVLGVTGSPYTVTATFNSTGADPNFVSTATKATDRDHQPRLRHRQHLHGDR